MSSNNSASPAVMRPTAYAGAIAHSHNGVSDANIGACVPKFNQIVAQSPVGNAWQGSETQVDFILDKSITKATKFTLEFDVNLPAATTAFIPSSAAFVSRIDWIYSGSVIETVYGYELFNESIALHTDQELKQEAVNWAVDITSVPGTPQPFKLGGTAAPAVVKRPFYLDLTGVIPTAQLFIAGIKGELRLRVYLANQCVSTNVTAGFVSTSATCLTLSSLTLWVEEATMSASSINALMSQHESGINYRSVIRSVLQKSQNNLSANNQQIDVMTSFTNDSAGLLVSVHENTADPYYSTMFRYSLGSIQLLDAGGSTLTRNLPTSLIERQITTNQVPISSDFVNSNNFSFYLMPFSSSLGRVLEGKVLGGLKLTAAEQLAITPVAGSPVLSDSAKPLETVVSFDYCSLRVQGGVLQWAKTAGDISPW